jgi:hypothetical protein
MKFFVPATKDAKEAENVYGILQKKIRQAKYNPTDVRVYSITFEDNGQELTETVGQSSPIAHENVAAIFETEDVYLICTTNRGILRGLPIAAGKWAITQVETFDAE